MGTIGFGRVHLMALMALMVPHAAHATEIGVGGHPLGLGLTIGQPPGLTLKYYLGGRRNAIEGLVGVFGYRGNYDGWFLQADYLWHPSVLTSESGFELPWHVGVGGFIGEDYYGYLDNWRGFGDTTVGVYVPIGLDLDLTDVRLQFSGDLFGRLFVIPEIGLDIGAAISIRYYF